jgi:hypothetical protein
MSKTQTPCGLQADSTAVCREAGGGVTQQNFRPTTSQSVPMFDFSFIDESLTDYWWDEGLLQSHAQLSKFSEVEWKELAVSWQLQSEEWQDRLAYILDDPSSPRHVGLLLFMLKKGGNVVSLRAAEVLRGMPFEIVKQVTVSQAQALSIPLREAIAFESINTIVERVAPPSKAKS